MTKEAIIEKTVRTLNVLPDDKAEEIADFAESVMKKHEESIIQDGIQTIIQQGETFRFLKDEEDLYSMKDIIQRY